MKTIYMMVGIPGSGKSYYAKNVLCARPHTAYVSRDEVRFKLLKDDEDYFSKEKEVYRNFICEIVNAFHNSSFESIIADATHLNWASRHKLIANLERAIGKDNFCVVPVVVVVPLKTALERNSARTGRSLVPDKVIKNMYSHLTYPNTDDYTYNNILYVDNK